MKLFAVLFALAALTPARSVSVSDEPDGPVPREHAVQREDDEIASIYVNISRSHPVSDRLYGVFFEEINHAGDGGLYAEMIQDRGIANTGFWGVPVEAGKRYHLTMYLAVVRPAKDNVITITLEDASGLNTYASASQMPNEVSAWHKYTAVLLPNATDYNAMLAVHVQGPAVLLVSMVSLFPAENIVPGQLNPWPFRRDLLQMVKDLKPRFLRFPGGCYVEGYQLANRFNWKTATGGIEERPGHPNTIWGYWSTDGLGLFEYMQLSEELGAEPLGDALNSIEFIMGDANSTWGGKRAAMGRVKPWHLQYFAIGNEDCGKPFYTTNYLAFFFAIRARYPHMRLIANCHMGLDAPTDLWDWHAYTTPEDMFALRTAFDGMNRSSTAAVFASEYAVKPGAGNGNLLAAVAEAGFMTGLERNSEVVEMASYAPLFANIHDRAWTPDLIVFDNHRVYGTPSYHVQRLFPEHQGVRYAHVDIINAPATSPGFAQPVTNLPAAGPADPANRLASSATCQDDHCSALSLKVSGTPGVNEY
ncbi:hypothetical protein WJX72_012237 [[Myrmecia] bisecta]|uniref:non-reducing end alpha-L-arabinofuranosidase n=1 Tax=[Myrmecia] bisecta TaxID=41462 RepID=A0AAW1Q3R0_9CHLO